MRPQGGGLPPVPAPQRPVQSRVASCRHPLTALFWQALLGAGEEELQHIARPGRAIGRGPVPQFVVGDHRSALRTSQGQPFDLIAGSIHIVLRPRHQRRRPHIRRHLVRIVQHQDIARAVVAHIAAEGIILVPILGLVARREIVAVAVAAEGIPRPQNAGQGRIYCRVGEQLVQ